MTISEKAVEAAARAICRVTRDTDDDWKRFTPEAEAVVAALTLHDGWQQIDDAAKQAAQEEIEPVLIGWYARDRSWCWVSAWWNGDEWCADGYEIAHCIPTHWFDPRKLPAPPFIADYQQETKS